MNASLLQDNLVAAALQAGLLVLAAAPLPRLLGVRSPRARLVYWRVVLAACVLLPLLQPRVPAAAPPSLAAAEPVVVAAATSPAAPAEAARTPAGAGGRDWRALAGRVIAGGVALRLAWLALGLLALSRLRRTSPRLWPRPRTIDRAVEAAGADAEFLVSRRALRPMTFGVLRPVVLLPPAFASFPCDEQVAVACHELLHVRRLDWIRAAADEVIRSVAWFHPAAWWLIGQIHLSREQLVDEQVVRRTGCRGPYLQALLRLASFEARGGLLPASLFLGRAHLPQRVALLVKEVPMSRPRLALSFAAMASALALCAGAAVSAFPLHAGEDETTVSVRRPSPAPAAAAAATAIGQQKVRPARGTGTPRRIRDVRPVIPAGSAAAAPAAWLFEVTLDASGRVAAVEPLSPASDPASEAIVDAVRGWRYEPPPTAPYSFLVGFNPAAGRSDPAQPPVLIGGDVKAPRKTADVRPVYPADAQEARVQGVVIVEARLDSEGAVSQAEIIRSVPMLDEAALEAVLGWRYEPPGFPLQMTVTINFVLDDGARPGAGRTAAKGGAGGGAPGGGAGVGAPGEAAPPEGYVRVGDAVEPPVKVVDVRPVYPEAARAEGVEGLVVIEATIGPDGSVGTARVLRSVPALDEAALEAVRQWKFTPTFVDGKAVGVVMTVTVNFTLK